MPAEPAHQLTWPEILALLEDATDTEDDTDGEEDQ